MGISAQAPWLKFYGDMPAHLDYPRLTIYQIVRRTAREHPGLVAYEFMNKETSYAQFMHRIDRTARALVALGTGRTRGSCRTRCTYGRHAGSAASACPAL